MERCILSEWFWFVQIWGRKGLHKESWNFVLVLLLPVTNHVTYLQNPFLGVCSFICKMKDIWQDTLYSFRSTLSYSVGNPLINFLLILFILDDFTNYNGTICLPFNRLILLKKANYMSFSHPLSSIDSPFASSFNKGNKTLSVSHHYAQETDKEFFSGERR